VVKCGDCKHHMVFYDELDDGSTMHDGCMCDKDQEDKHNQSCGIIDIECGEFEQKEEPPCVDQKSN
jgi:hypothetical protein